MALKLANNAQSTLAGAISDSDTLLSVQVGDGGKFPSLSTGDWFPLTLVNASKDTEIVRCTARTGDVLTIERAQEGTAARAWSGGDSIGLRVTAGALQTLVPDGASLLAGNNLSDLTNTVSARSNLGLGDAATHTASDFATAAQGAKADAALPAASAKTVALTGSYADLINKPALATVATSGSYNDLGNKPSLGTAAALNAGVGANNVVQLNSSAQLPAVSGALLTNLPTPQIVPSSVTMPVGWSGLLYSSGPAPQGSSIAGSSLRIAYSSTPTGGWATDGNVQTGTWTCWGKGVNGGVSLFVRTA